MVRRCGPGSRCAQDEHSRELRRDLTKVLEDRLRGDDVGDSAVVERWIHERRLYKKKGRQAVKPAAPIARLPDYAIARF